MDYKSVLDHAADLLTDEAEAWRGSNVNPNGNFEDPLDDARYCDLCHTAQQLRDLAAAPQPAPAIADDSHAVALKRIAEYRGDTPMTNDEIEAVWEAFIAGIDSPVDIDKLCVQSREANALRRYLNEARDQLDTKRSELTALETVCNLCLEALPGCQAYGDVPGHIEEMRDQLAALRASLAPVREKLEQMRDWAQDLNMHHLADDALRLLAGIGE